MDEDAWKRRLEDEIKRNVAPKGRSLAKLSREARVGRNYVQQFMKYGKAPGADIVVKLCRALRVSITYIFTGVKLSPQDEEFLQLLGSLPEDVRARQIANLRDLQLLAQQRGDEVQPLAPPASQQEDS